MKLVSLSCVLGQGQAIKSHCDSVGSICILQVQFLYTSLLKQQEEQTKVALLEQQVLIAVASKFTVAF